MHECTNPKCRNALVPNALNPNYSNPDRDPNGWYQDSSIAYDLGNTFQEREFIVTNGFGIRDNDIRDNDMVGKVTFRKHAFGKKAGSHEQSTSIEIYVCNAEMITS